MTHPALVDEATFAAIQGMRAARPTQHGHTRTYILTELGQCRLCGRRLDSHWVNRRPGFDAVRDHAFTDVPVAANQFPVVVLAPGMGFAAPQYTRLAENLASHGYLVDIWAADDRFAAARVATLDSSGRFAGHVDAARTIYLGHSFGGAAALEACSADPHCAGAADLDGTQYGTVVHTGLTKPIRTQLALGPINGGDALTITNAYLTAFADHVTRSRPEPLLTGLTPYPQVDVQRTAS
ncbi:hypothetical protein [Amycolatopsis sp. cmx-4-68]|uniref:hypothetical protein n=1 Tax=Amycolatopsis sp. cmx-4-68 TaxID=2790938 RepID=UPI00397C9D43